VDFKAGRDPDDYCSRYSSEIMITGFIISGLAMAILVTTYFRGRLGFTVFFYTHMLVFPLYALCACSWAAI